MIDKVAQIGLTCLCHFYMLGFWVGNGLIWGISAKVAREGQTYLCQNCVRIKCLSAVVSPVV